MQFINRAHRAATIYGAAPLLLATVVFFSWIVTRWDGLMFAGLALIFGGLLSFALGMAKLARSVWDARKQPDLTRRALWTAILITTALLLVNFPVAAGMVGAAGAIRNRHTVIVRNSSPQRLDNVRVFGAGCEASFGSIPPGATEKRSFRFLLAGDLSFQASIGNDVMETAIRGYVHDHTHGYDTVTVEPDQDVSVLAGGIANASLLDRIREAVFWPDRALCRP